MESTAQFPVFNGPPGYFAVEGKVFHRVRSTHENSAVRWLLYDGFMHSFAPHQRWIDVLPTQWVDAMKDVMLRINPFASRLRQLSLVYSFGFPQARLVLNEDDVANELLLYLIQIHPNYKFKAGRWSLVNWILNKTIAFKFSVACGNPLHIRCCFLMELSVGVYLNISLTIITQQLRTMSTHLQLKYGIIGQDCFVNHDFNSSED
ncbi:hypothetical protein K439DRAFT_1621784 [Ramaria rubella]|nr:hypothetical protein K439DRAFT_1621784 [Ramaria rubella]